MNDAPSTAALQFDQIRINIGKDSYLIQKDGRVRYLDKAMIWRGARSSLALFDPCEQLTNEKKISPKMIVVTSSPSHVVGQVGKYSLTELATKFVLAIWTLDELLLIMPNVDHERLEKFGFRIGSTTYCVPRWFFYRKQDIQGFISDGWDHASKDALKDYFLKGPDDEHKNKNLPYRLCTIEQNGDNDWKVTGFISDYVAGLVYDWARIAQHLDRGTFLNLLNHPLGCCLIGSWYERWATECLGQQVCIIISKDQLYPEVVAPGDAGVKQAIARAARATRRAIAKISGVAETVPDDEHPISVSRFKFETLKIVDVDVPQDGSEPKFEIYMKPGVLYKPRSNVNSSIDAFGVTGDGVTTGDLILLQFTKALGHSSARKSDLNHIIKAARALSARIRVILVYCVPSVKNFKIPKCETIQDSDILICKGMIDMNFYLELKKPRMRTVESIAGPPPESLLSGPG